MVYSGKQNEAAALDTPDLVAHRNLIGGSDMQTYPSTRARPSRVERICERCGKSFTVPGKLITRALKKGHRPRPFCGRKCLYAAPLIPPEVRFWSNVEKTERCWWWKGAPGAGGYGRVRLSGKSMPAHRAAYILSYGPIPDGLLACHDCDRFYPPGDITYRRCVRPDHLFLGTHKDNQEDMTRKGRGRIGIRSGQSKLTEAQVIEIRQRYKAGGISQEKLGKEYGITQGGVGHIVRGTIWAHLPL